MKKILVAICFIVFMGICGAHAQKVVWHDDFETSKGWSEYEEKDKGQSAVIKDGVMQIKGKDEDSVISKCKTNLDGNKNFTIKCDVTVKNGLKPDNFIGLIFDYFDSKNYKVFYVEKGYVYFKQYKEGNCVRYERDNIKNNGKKDLKQLTFELQRKGRNVMFLVNDEETIDMDEIEVHSNRIALMVSGDQLVFFDNVEILQ